MSRTCIARLRINSLKLEDVGLRHISGPDTLRRSLLLERNPEALEVFASVLEPVSFGERSETQHTNGYTAIDRLVDATIADPPSRQQIAGDVEALTGNVIVPQVANEDLRLDLSGDVAAGPLPSRAVAVQQLRQRFLSWQAAEPHLLEDMKRTPRLNDTAVRIEQLGALADTGMSAITYLETHTAPPAGWQQAQLAIIDNAQQPSALVRFTFLNSMRKLVIAAGAR